jgi:hypothetical protein
VKTAETRLGHTSPQVALGIYARSHYGGRPRSGEQVGARFQPVPFNRRSPGGHLEVVDPAGFYTTRWDINLAGDRGHSPVR